MKPGSDTTYLYLAYFATPCLVITLSQNLKYAEDGPHVTSTSLPPPPQTDNVQGTSLTCNDTVSSDYKEDVGRSTHVLFIIPSNILLGYHPLCFLTDHSVCLDQILIQLKEVAPKWRELAVAVGAENVNEIVRKELKSLCCLVEH